MEVPEYTELDPEGDTMIILNRHGLQYKMTEEDPDADAWLVRTTQYNDDKVRFRVSSCHLCLASPKAKEVLRRQPHTGDPLQARHRITKIPCPNDHPAALLILLCLIHAKPFFVPERIGLNLLVYMSRLIDKYELHEAIQYRDTWLEPPSWDASSQWELVARVYVAWAFRQPRMFKDATTMLAARGNERIRAGDFQIPNSIIGAIKAQRIDALEAGCRAFGRILTERFAGSALCRNHRNCSQHVVESLERSLRAANLLDERGLRLYGISFKRLQNFVNRLEIRSSCELYNARHAIWLRQPPACAVLPKLHEEFAAIWPTLGLELANFILA